MTAKPKRSNEPPSAAAKASGSAASSFSERAGTWAEGVSSIAVFRTHVFHKRESIDPRACHVQGSADRERALRLVGAVGCEIEFERLFLVRGADQAIAAGRYREARRTQLLLEPVAYGSGRSGAGEAHPDSAAIA